MSSIESESRFIWKFILHTLLIPINLLLVLFKKKTIKDVFQPFIDLIKFIFEPKFTISIIILNIILFILSHIYPDIFLNLINYPSDIINLQYAYRFITAGFLHADIFHLLGNMLGIFIFGRVVERELGLLKTSLIYFGALILSGLFSAAINLLILQNNIPGLGASGALMGLVSAAILLNPFYLTYELIIPLPIIATGILTIYADISGILNPTADGIGHFAHIGGYLSIALLMFSLSSQDREKIKKGFFISLITIAIIAAIYYFFPLTI